MLSRRALLAGLGATIITPRRSKAWIHGSFFPTGFPGQFGNPVGFAAAPGFITLSAWPGGTGLQTISDGTHAQSGAGTVNNPWVFNYYDFNAGTSGTNINASGSYFKFVGCRFQSNQQGFYNFQVTNGNVSFSYCSFVPLASLYTSTPNPQWPTSGIGNTANQEEGVNCINGNSGFQTGVSIPSTAGSVTCDHCDCWGSGNSFVQMSTGSAGITITDCWVHDPAYSVEQIYHIDGIGYVDGANAPSNITIKHCTVSSCGGQSNGIAFQSATSAYSNISLINCYLSGYGLNSDLGHAVAGNNNWTVTDNIWSTDVAWIFGPIFEDFSAMFTRTNGLNNLWRRNRLFVYPGSSPAIGAGFSFNASNNLNYIYPNSNLSTSDWAN